MPANASEKMAMAADDGTMRGVSNPSGAGKAASTVTKAVVMASPMPPLKAVRKAPSTKNCVRMARCVAPSAFRSPISGSFGDRDEHDVDNADRPQCKRDHSDH